VSWTSLLLRYFSLLVLLLELQQHFLESF